MQQSNILTRFLSTCGQLVRHILPAGSQGPTQVQYLRAMIQLVAAENFTDEMDNLAIHPEITRVRKFALAHSIPFQFVNDLPVYQDIKLALEAIASNRGRPDGWDLRHSKLLLACEDFFAYIAVPANAIPLTRAYECIAEAGRPYHGPYPDKTEQMLRKACETAMAMGMAIAPAQEPSRARDAFLVHLRNYAASGIGQNPR